jgi:hypothetical protein
MVPVIGATEGTAGGSGGALAGTTGARVAVNVTGWPATDGLLLEVRMLEVGTAETTCSSGKTKHALGRVAGTTVKELKSALPG